MIDLDSLRRTIAAAPNNGKAMLPVTRSLLEDIEREIREGRIARAQLAQQAGVAALTQAILTGPHA